MNGISLQQLADWPGSNAQHLWQPTQRKAISTLRSTLTSRHKPQPQVFGLQRARGSMSISDYFSGSSNRRFRGCTAVIPCQAGSAQKMRTGPANPGE